jgi:hypothetical protein
MANYRFGLFAFSVGKFGGEDVNMEVHYPTTMGTLLNMSWAELRPEVAWLKLKPGSMRNVRLIGGPGKCGSDARGGERQGYFIQNGLMQRNAAAGGCKIEQLPFPEPILPGGTF